MEVRVFWNYISFTGNIHRLNRPPGKLRHPAAPEKSRDLQSSYCGGPWGFAESGIPSIEQILIFLISSGFGSIIQLYPGGGPVRAATACFGFPKSFLSGLYEFPLNKVDSLLNGTFSAEMLSSEPKDSASVEESNGTLEEKQTSEQETEDSMAEAPESHHPPEQETMEIVSQEPEYKEPKERGSKKDYVSVKSPPAFTVFPSEFQLTSSKHWGSVWLWSTRAQDNKYQNRWRKCVCGCTHICDVFFGVEL